MGHYIEESGMCVS